MTRPFHSWPSPSLVRELAVISDAGPPRSRRNGLGRQVLTVTAGIGGTVGKDQLAGRIASGAPAQVHDKADRGRVQRQARHVQGHGNPAVAGVKQQLLTFEPAGSGRFVMSASCCGWRSCWAFRHLTSGCPTICSATRPRRPRTSCLCVSSGTPGSFAGLAWADHAQRR